MENVKSEMKAEIMEVFDDKKIKVESSCESVDHIIFVLSEKVKERRLWIAKKILDRKGYDLTYLLAEYVCYVGRRR